MPDPSTFRNHDPPSAGSSTLTVNRRIAAWTASSWVKQAATENRGERPCIPLKGPRFSVASLAELAGPLSNGHMTLFRLSLCIGSVGWFCAVLACSSRGPSTGGPADVAVDPSSVGNADASAAMEVDGAATVKADATATPGADSADNPLDASAVGSNGAPWYAYKVAVSTTNTLYGIYRTATGSDEWVVGVAGTLLHRVGIGALDLVPSPTSANLRAVAGAGARLWIGGDDGTLLVSKDGGATWASLDVPQGGSIRALWAGSEADLWATGLQGLLFHVQNGIATSIDTGTRDDLYAMWGASARDIWAVGKLGLILHFDGTGWTKVDGATSSTLFAISGRSSRDVWAAGSGGVLVAWDGTAWTRLHDSLSACTWPPGQGGSCSLLSVVRTASDVLAGAADGIVYRWNGSDLVSANSISFAALYAGVQSNYGVRFVGENGAALVIAQ